MAERTGTIPNSHTVFSGFITPGRCLYITRTGLWLPVFKYYCPSGPRHVCHLKQIIACSSSLLCFKSCKKASTLPAELEMKMYDSSPNSQSGAIAAGSNGLLSPWELESEDLIFPNPLVTCYVQSTLPHSPALYFSSCLRSIFFFGLHWRLVLQRNPLVHPTSRTTSYLDCGCSCQSQSNSRNTMQKV